MVVWSFVTIRAILMVLDHQGAARDQGEALRELNGTLDGERSRGLTTQIECGIMHL